MKYVPNALTIGRILVTPILLWLLFSDTLLDLVWALGLFIIAAISDYLDGRLARTYSVRSRLGQFLDPFADKVLVLGTFTALAFIIPESVPWWGVVLIALRDAWVTGLRTWSEARGRVLRTLRIAKWKTVVQLVFLIAILLLLPARRLPGPVGEAALWLLESDVPFYGMMVVVAFTVVTGIWYLFHQEYVSPAKFNG